MVLTDMIHMYASQLTPRNHSGLRALGCATGLTSEWWFVDYELQLP